MSPQADSHSNISFAYFGTDIATSKFLIVDLPSVVKIYIYMTCKQMHIIYTYILEAVNSATICCTFSLIHNILHYLFCKGCGATASIT